jgi:hypothetical protein
VGLQVGQDTTLARQILRKLLDGRLVFSPKGKAGDRWYEFAGEGTLAKFLADVPSIKAVVPVRGSDAFCYPLRGSLKPAAA